MMIERKGFTLAEVLVASSLVTAFVVGLVWMYGVYAQASRTDPLRAKAVFLAEEGIEELKLLRAESWSANIAAAPASAAEYVDATFLRETTLTPSGALVLATVSVSWPTGGATTTVSLSTYIADLYEN